MELGLVILAYILPMLVALARGHHNAGAIVALALLAGWTVIGWLIAMVWSLTAVRRRA